MIKRIFSNMTKRGKGMLSLSILFFVLYALSGAAMMLVVLNMLEGIIGGEQVVLLPYWLSLGAIVLFKAICNVVADMCKHFAGFDIVEQIRKKMVLCLKRFSLGFYTKERLGEISTIVQKDVDNMEHVVGHMWSRMTSDFIVALVLGIGLFLVDWRLGLSMIALLPIAILVLILGIKSAKKHQTQSQDDLADMVSLFVEYVKGITLLKAFRKSKSFQNSLNKSAKRFGDSSKKTAKSVAGYLGRYSFFVELGFALLATLGAYLVLREGLTVFEYLMFIILSREFYKPFVGMEAHWMNYIKVTDSYKRISTILDAPVIKTPENPQPINAYDILFQGVGFSYEEGEFELKNADFHLKEGTLTAMVGPSGSGKTTITNLLLRFWEPQSGMIQIGGVDIRAVDYDELLGNVSIVMQNVILFADTIYNNIKVGKHNATREEVVEAAKRAMIHDFIMSLPEQYETRVGENGVGLSGGQKQRVSIARAFLKDAPIVVLDEITSNVDPVNEAKIQQAISRLAKNRTVLVIAHHLRTIRSADTILVLSKGEIVQAGSHYDLIDQIGLYRSLWDAQEKAKNWKVSESINYDSAG